MSAELKHKIVVIIGAAGSIGYEIADSFMNKGATTVLLDINKEKGSEVTAKLNSKYNTGKAIFYEFDITTDAQLTPKKILDEFGKIDIFVNCAGVLDELDRVKALSINVTGVLECTLQFWNLMSEDKEGNGGLIILLSSTDGLRINRFLPTYQAANVAVVTFAKSLGHKYHYDKTGVRVVALCPGMTESQFWANPRTMVDKQWHDNGWMQPEFLEHLKSQPWQKADVVGKAALELFEKAESGTVWVVEGGNPVVEVK